MRLWALVLGLLLVPAAVSGVTLGQIDTFEDGTTQGWSEGVLSPNPPVNVADGGPEGAGDNYLHDQSSGTGTAGSRMILFNTAQWTGNYMDAGVGRIRIAFEVSGGTDLPMRIAFQGGTLSTRFTTQAITIPSDRTWHTVEFDLGSLVRISGPESVDAVLADVKTVRILAATSPDWVGDIVAATLCIDNIEAVSAQVPVLPATWGGLKQRYRFDPERPR